MTNPIVVGTDGSPSADRAVEWAAAEAVRRGRRSHIVYAAPARECELTNAGEPILVRAAALAAKAVPDVAVTTELMSEAPAFALREQGERAAEVVVGHRGHDGLA